MRTYEKRRHLAERLFFRKASPIIDSLSSVLGVSIALFDARGEPIYQSAWRHPCCEMIKVAVAKRETDNVACSAHYARITDYVKNYRMPYVQKCHAGFATVAYPIIMQDVTQERYLDVLLGTLFFSPLHLPEQGSTHDEEYFMRKVQELSVPEHEQFVDALQHVKSMSELEFNQMIALTRAMFGEIVESSSDIVQIVENSVAIQNELTLLYDFAKRAGGKVNPTDILTDVWDVLDKNIKPTKLCILLYDEYAKELTPIDGLSSKIEHIEVGSIPMESGEGFLAEAIKDGRSVIKNNLQNDLIFQHIPELSAKKGLACPIMLDERLLGLIVLFDKANGEDFFADDAKFTDTLAGSIGVAFEIISLTARLAEAADSWKDVSFRAAHKMGNALFALKGPIAQMELLQSKGKLTDDKIAELVERVNERMEEADSIIRTFKGYIRPDELNLIKQDINSVLEKVIQNMHLTIGEQITLKAQFAEGLPVLQLDASRIAMAVGELIQNATHFIDGTGEIVVRTDVASNVEKKQLDITEYGEFIAIEVSDTGTGVPDENKEKIFYPFFSTRGIGTGQGLAIVATDVRQHGGEIKEIGKYGKGAKFLILLPVDRNKGEADAENINC